jgi:acetylornithine deacetylase/succinyl-diaminopimelate desuccinylase-like protein
VSEPARSESAVSESAGAALVDDVMARVTPERLLEAIVSMVGIPSPTGGEAPLARWLVGRMRDAGLAARVQDIDAAQANALGRVRGTGTGRDLLLYAPIDTLLVGQEESDLPWAGPVWRPDMRPEAGTAGSLVSGLGASNPKGHAACVLVAAQAFAEVVGAGGEPRSGDLVVGFGAGGMPTNAVEGVGEAGGRANTGHGAGCSFLLERGGHADVAVIAKPGDFVAFDEVGLCWFEVTVSGAHTYVGSRHRLAYRNPIVTAADVITRLEEWLASYAERHRTDTAKPQGIIGSVAGGWERMVAVTPAVVRLRLDLRIAPGTAPAAVRRELAAFLQQVAVEVDAEIDVELVNAIVGTTTDPDGWFVTESISAWEAASGHPHVPVRDNSGATDANILRSRGIPTVRIGMPKVVTPAGDLDFEAGMNTVDIDAMRRLCEVLVRLAVTVTGTDAGPFGVEPPSLKRGAI